MSRPSLFIAILILALMAMVSLRRANPVAPKLQIMINDLTLYENTLTSPSTKPVALAKRSESYSVSRDMDQELMLRERELHHQKAFDVVYNEDAAERDRLAAYDQILQLEELRLRKMKRSLQLAQRAAENLL